MSLIGCFQPWHAYRLRRFVEAQDAPAPGWHHRRYIDQALAELKAGQKRTHWMWFIFPQEKGLGSSEMSRRYAIRSKAEARAYLAHPVLGARLEQCAQAVTPHLRTLGAETVFGPVDAMKFVSCMTLFAMTADDMGLRRVVFDRALRAEFGYRSNQSPGVRR